MDEAAEFQQMERSIQEWFNSPRFKFTKRPYTAQQVASLRGSISETPASAFTSKKLYNLLRTSFDKGEYSHTFGALDPVQVVQMAKYLSCVYVSGWQSSSTASTSNEPGPDFADYPSDTVPNKVEQLFRAQLFHDRRQREERFRMTPEQRAKTKPIDFLRPIIADGDTGFGGVTSVMKMVKMQVLAGAAGIHIEDQGVGVKKCGHMGGKVLIPMREHLDRLSAARLQCDIMGVETVLIARTDACSATLLTTNIDPRDHPFILGSTVREAGSLEDAKDQDKWVTEAKMKTYPDCIADAMKAAGKSQGDIDSWLKEANQMSNMQARARAAALGFGSVFWDWDAPRAREGYYRVQGSTQYSIARGLAFSSLADCIWMETATPDINEAEEFADGVHKVVPHQMLAYNLSPSFNWSGMKGMDDNAIRKFQTELGKRGFAWHFITLAGFHANALMIDQFAKAYAGPDGVFAYVSMVQREERRHEVETLLHQKWSGAELMDNAMMIATGGGASTASLKGATEDQFKNSKL